METFTTTLPVSTTLPIASTTLPVVPVLCPTWTTDVGIQHVTSVLKIPYVCHCPIAQDGQCVLEVKAEFWRPIMEKDLKNFIEHTVDSDPEYHKYTQI